jgi:hypothetical protein
MLTLTKRLCTGIVGLMLLFVAASSANAQSFGGRLSTGEKVGAIGGGAAAGALIGGLLGGTKGAIIGGALGAAGGTAYVATQGRDHEWYRRDYRYRSTWNDRRWDGYRYSNGYGYSNGYRYSNDRWDRDRDRDCDHDRDGRSGYRGDYYRFRR